MLLKIFILSYSLLFILKNAINCQELDKKSRNIIKSIFNEFQSLGYSQIKQEHLVESVWEIIDGSVEHFNSYCVNSLIKLYKTSPEEIWLNERNIEISMEKFIHDSILVCRELPDWQNICTGDTLSSIVDLIASDLHLAISILYEEQLETSKFRINAFCDISVDLMNKNKEFYNYLCVKQLLNYFSRDNNRIGLKESIAICSATTFWSEVCTKNNSNDFSMPPEVNLLASSLFFQIKNNKDKYMFENSSIFDKLSFVEFCEIAYNINLKGDILKYFNVLCVNELSTPKNFFYSEISWFPSTRSVLEICVDNIFWISCSKSEYEQLEIQSNSSEKTEISKFLKSSIISLLASTLIQQIHQLPTFMFSSLYYQFAEMSDICNIAIEIQKNVDELSESDGSAKSQINLGPYFNSICWRVLSLYPITFNTGIGILTQPIKTMEAISICRSSLLFWNEDCVFNEAENSVYSHQITILSQELLIGSKKFYSFPRHTFCVAAKNIILNLNNLNYNLGSSIINVNDINLILNNIKKSDFQLKLSGISSGFFNRECVRELLGSMEKNRELIPLHFAIDICSTSLRWEKCPVEGNPRRYLTEFIASEFYYGLLNEPEIQAIFDWTDICSISTSILPKEYENINTTPFIPYFNHYCSINFLNSQYLKKNRYKYKSENNLYSFTKFLKVCVHNYFWRSPCGELIELDLLANSLFFGTHQFESMQNIPETSFCKPAKNLLEVNPRDYSNECIREVMNINPIFTSEVAELSCKSTHRFPTCHGFSEEYTPIATTLFNVMYQYSSPLEVPSFLEFCSIVDSIYKDPTIVESPYFFDAICAEKLHQSNLNLSFMKISILCSHISTNVFYHEHFSISILVSEFFRKSRSINSLKKWEAQYFYPLAKGIWENEEKNDFLFENFNSKCVKISRSVISTENYKLKLNDAVSLCSGSIAFKFYCKNEDSNLQLLTSEIIQGIYLTLNIQISFKTEIESICHYARLIYNNSVEKLPLTRDDPYNSSNYPYFLNSCVEILSSGIFLPNRVIWINLNEAVLICTQSSYASIACKDENTLVSILSAGLCSEIKYLPEFSNIGVADLCNISSQLVDATSETYLEKCMNYFKNYKLYIANTNHLKIQLSELQRQKICTKPYKWRKCKLTENLDREFYSVKLETLASKLVTIFVENKLDIWNFERHCRLAEKIIKLNAKSSYKTCISVLKEFEYLEMIRQRIRENTNPLFLYYRLEDSVIFKICNELTSSDECIDSANKLTGLLAENFYSISTNYLDFSMMKTSDFCLISEILLQKGSAEEMKQHCPYILSQITNLEHWPQIMLTQELAVTICNDLNILNLQCVRKSKSKGITEELSLGINQIAIQLFFFRKKYISTFNPESSCLMAESLIQVGIKNQYFNYICNNLISYDIWNFSKNLDSKYNYYWTIGNQDPDTFFKFIKDEAKQICFDLEKKLSKIYMKSHNYIKKRDKAQIKINDKNYNKNILKRILNPLNFNYKKLKDKNNSLLNKEQERAELKKKLMIISKAKGYISLDDDVIKNYNPEDVDYKLAKKYFGEFLLKEYNSTSDSMFLYKQPEFDWNLFIEKIAFVSKKLIGIPIKISDPKSGNLSNLIQKWGYVPQGTIQGAQYIYRVSRYINKYMISPKKAYLIWKETLISMGHSIIPKWRESWKEEIRKPTPLDEQPLPTCEGIKSSKILRQLGMDNKRVSMVALANIDSFVSQLTEAAHDMNLFNIKFSDFCIVGIILFNLKSYSRTESFNYQCTKWVKEIGYLENYVEENMEIDEKFSKQSINRLKNGVRRQIPSEIARRICASTTRWMSCKDESDIDKKLRIDMLATELLRLSRITGLEFRDMCEIAIQIANSQDFNQRCPLLLQPIVNNYNRALHVCKSTSFWKSCHYSKNSFDVKLLEHLDVLTLELTLGLNEIFKDTFTYEEICHLTDKFVATDYFKRDCVNSILNFLINQRFTRSTLNIYGDMKFSTTFKHLISVALTVCYDTFRWQQITCSYEDDIYSLNEKQWIDLVSEEILAKMILLKKKKPEVSIFFKDNERDSLIEKFNFENGSKYKLILPPNLKYQDICKEISKISKTRYFNINCIQSVSDIFRVQLSKIKLDEKINSDFEIRNVYKNVIKVPEPSVIEEICKGSIFWESCSNSYLNSFIDLEIHDENKIETDIVVNDIMISILQLNEIQTQIEHNFTDHQTKSVNDIRELAINTLNSLTYSDFCEIGIWYSGKISRYVNSEYSELQNSLSDAIMNLILKNMYPNRKIEKNEFIPDVETPTVETLDSYIEDAIFKLPETLPKLKIPPSEMFRNQTEIKYILVQYSRNYDDNQVYKIELNNTDLFLNFYINRNVSYISKDIDEKIINVRPIPGLKLHMCQLSNGEIKYPKFENLYRSNKYLTSIYEMEEILNIMKKNPTNFHKSIIPHATIQIMRKTNLNKLEKRIKKQWLKEIKQDYFYKKGREIAIREWDLREIAENNYNGTGRIKWEIESKKNTPNVIYALFNENARKKREEGKLFNKGLYKARVHHFLLKKLIRDQDEKRKKYEMTRKIFLKTSEKRTSTETNDHFEYLYSEQEINVAKNIAAMIGYNQIAVDLIQ